MILNYLYWTELKFVHLFVIFVCVVQQRYITLWRESFSVCVSLRVCVWFGEVPFNPGCTNRAFKQFILIYMHTENAPPFRHSQTASTQPMYI